MSLLGLIGKNAQLHGITVGNRSAHQSMCRHIESSDIHPVIDRSYALDQSGDAILGIAEGSHFGKLVIDMTL